MTFKTRKLINGKSVSCWGTVIPANDDTLFRETFEKINKEGNALEMAWFTESDTKKENITIYYIKHKKFDK
jgi:hypothetical protein